jgi:SAM-dependent methyltransferase
MSGIDDAVDDWLDGFLYLHWLRPENLPWDVAASRLIAPYLRGPGKKLEIGVGPGYTTFMYLGGVFSPEFDWYFNVDTRGFWENRDIYDADEARGVARHVEVFPPDRLHVALDHKANLIGQARELGIADSYIVADANEPFPIQDIDFIYSNALYWLRDPKLVLERIHAKLPPGGRCMLVFPSDVFFDYCRSYRRDTPMWTLLNRGRADTLMWTMSVDAFMRDVAGPAGFQLERQESYLSRQTMKVWDIGLRPVSPYLIDMANSLAPERRLEIKHEWCSGLRPILQELVEEELRDAGEGAYNFVVLANS